MKLLKACIALAAVAALFVVPSIASATSPTLFQTTPEVVGNPNDLVPVGSNIIGTNVAHAGTVTTTRFTTDIGTVECTTATLTGTVTKNSGGAIEGNITTANFSGTAGVTPHTNHCTSPLGAITVTPSHSTNPSHNGVGSLPWCVRAVGLQDKITVRGGNCSEAARALTFALHTPVGVCSYQRASVTATYTTHPADAVATVDPNMLFTKTTGSAFCPNSGTLDMAFTLTTDLAGDKEGLPLNVT